MPLPAALAAKLARRGILHKGSGTQNENEEVIVESYDGQEPSSQQNTNEAVEKLDEFGNPLPEIWEKVWDSEYETWYYWDTATDLVSWLPPSDPEAIVTYPASHITETRPVERIPERRPPAGNKRQVRWQSKPKRKDDEVDPMDPSSYSDAPTGNWQSGLIQPDDAKTGVDTTASGPLFQQRPYPSPGEVLKRNKSAQQNMIQGPKKPN